MLYPEKVVVAQFNALHLYEAEEDMKNYADRGGCHPPRPTAKVDNTLQDLHNI